jgi:hypothetical protein
MKHNVSLTLVMGLLVLGLAVAAVGSVSLAGAAGHAQVPPKGTSSPGSPAGQPAAKQAGNPPQAPLSTSDTGFTYQGRLTQSGSPSNGQSDLQFTLFDAASGGNQVGSPVTVISQTVSDGLFTVVLNFGTSAFQGQARWLEVGVRPGGSGGSFTTLSPRQALTPAPYAVGLVPGAVITGTSVSALLTANNANGTGLYGISNNGTGVYALSTGLNGNGVLGEANNGSTAYGVFGRSTDGYGVVGRSGSGVGGYFTSSSNNAIIAQSQGIASAIAAISTYTSSVAVNGSNPVGIGVQGSGRTGVWGDSFAGLGVYGTSTSGRGGYFTGNDGYGVYAQSTNGIGGYFMSTNGTAVEGHASTSWDAVLAVNTGSGIGLHGQSTTGDAVQGHSAGGTGVAGTSGGANSGVYGSSVGGRGVYGTSDSSDGVYGLATGSNNAVYGQNTAGGTGVTGQSSTGSGVTGLSGSGAGGVFTSTGGYGVSGTSSSGHGVYGTSSGPGNGVFGFAAGSNTAVRGTNTSTGDGVYGYNSSSGNGVHGTSISGVGGNFTSASNDAVLGRTNSTFSGVAGFNDGTGPGVFGTSTGGYAGRFDGNVQVNGTLTANVKNFKIDDPLDPANKYLYHTSVESPDMLNIYRGHVTLDTTGAAWVQMPGYFEALNRDFDYQLTAIGAPGPNLYVAEKVKDNRFKIAGGKPGMEVSWLVTGVRHDPYAQAHPSPVEQAKPASEQGLYQYPELYNQPASKGIYSIYNATTGAQAQPQTERPNSK